MKALIAVLVVTLAPVHIRFAVLGLSVSAAWLIAAAEVLLTAALAVLVVRVMRRFRSYPGLRLVHAGGAR